MDQKQALILSQYREVFPEESLKETAKKTGIQVTRVFRIFNGYEMKLKEYSLLKSAIDEESDQRDILKNFEKCTLSLSQKRLERLNHYLRHLVKLSEIKQGFSRVEPQPNLLV